MKKVLLVLVIIIVILLAICLGGFLVFKDELDALQEGVEDGSVFKSISQIIEVQNKEYVKIDDDTYRFIAFTFNNASIVGNSGKLFDLEFVPAAGVEYKNVPIVIDNVVLSNSDANNYTSQLTLNAKAEYSNYYVRFVCDGEIVSETFQRAGTKIVQPQMPERTGYTFGGWENVPELSPAEDVVYTGEYNVNKYKLDYLVNGVVFATDSIAYGSTITLLEEPTKEGYTFSGWSEAPATMPAEDVVIEGCFSPITSINGVVYDAENLIIYNLRGERIIDVDELDQGFYIINGKKVLVK